MKKCRVLNIMDTSMEGTNQRVAVVELAEIVPYNISLPSGAEPYRFGTKGKRYVFDFSSSICQRIIRAAHNEEIVSIDLKDFRVKEEIKDGQLASIHYHKDVRLVNLLEFEKEVSKEEDYLFKSIELKGNQLAMLNTGLIKNLFPKPQKGELLGKDLGFQYAKLYFKKEYFGKLISQINAYYLDGSFARSNANEDWMDLKNVIEGALPEYDLNADELNIHLLSDWGNAKRTKEDSPQNKNVMNIKFGIENRGSGLGRANDELWNSWQNLNNGSFEETENEIILKSSNGDVFIVKKDGELVAAPWSNKFLSADQKRFEVFEGQNPSGGYFILYRFKDPNRRNEYVISSISGIAVGSSISFKVEP